MISIDRTASFQSGSQTGTGSSQNVAHDLGAIPDMVIVQVDDESTATAILGTHTATNIVLTVTNAKTFKILAWVNGA